MTDQKAIMLGGSSAVRDGAAVHRSGNRRYPWPLCRVSKLAVPGRYIETSRGVTCQNCLRLP